MIFSASWSGEQSAASPTGVEVVTGAADPLPLALIVVGTGIGVGVGVVGGILVGVGISVGVGGAVAITDVAVGTAVASMFAVATCAGVSGVVPQPSSTNVVSTRTGKRVLRFMSLPFPPTSLLQIITCHHTRHPHARELFRPGEHQRMSRNGCPLTTSFLRGITISAVWLASIHWPALSQATSLSETVPACSYVAENI